MHKFKEDDIKTYGLRSALTPGYEQPTYFLPVEPFVPHPDTEPGVIRRRQDVAVREAVTRLGNDATPEQVAEDVCLPAWNVRRAMGLEAVPTAKTEKSPDQKTAKELPCLLLKVPVVAKALGAEGGLRVADLCVATGIGRATLAKVLRLTGRFRKERRDSWDRSVGCRKYEVWFNIPKEATDGRTPD
jgi:hypothetical protein